MVSKLSSGRNAMDFESSVKGNVAEALTAALLRGVDYRVIPLGVEHSVQELRALSESHPDAYQGAPEALRKLPDFLVLDLQPADALAPQFVEVKYRSHVDFFSRPGALHRGLSIQASTWGEIILVAFLGQPYVGAGNRDELRDAPTNSCRAFKIVLNGDGQVRIRSLALQTLGREFPLAEFDWLQGVPLQSYFSKLQNATTDQTIAKAVRIARSVHDAFSE